MFTDEFPIRLTQLRMQKGVSARDMSLSIGQNEGYINSIENGKALPSMAAFFFICDYLSISPSAFFDTENQNPEKINRLIKDIKRLNDQQLDSIAFIVKELTK